MASRAEWRKLLGGFAKHRYTMEAAIRDDLEQMDAATLKRVLAACMLPSQTNCDWATYVVAPLVRRLALDRLKTIEEDTDDA